MNPLELLEDLIPAKARKYVIYLLVPLVVVLYGVWKASDGNWAAFWPAIIPAVIGWFVAAPNTHPPVEVTDAPVVNGTVRPATDEETKAAESNAEGTYDDEDTFYDDVEVEE